MNATGHLPTGKSGLLRRILPAVGLLVVLAFLGARGFSAVESYDFWWHLKTGEWITQEGTLPTVDPYSFTAPDRPWIDHSWLFQVMIHQLFRAGGLPALAGLRIILLLVTVGCIGIYLKRESVPDGIAGLLLIVCLWGACFRLTIRPDLVSVCFTAVFLFLLLGYRRSRKPILLWVIAGLIPLWANLHVGALLVPLILAPFAGEPFLSPHPVGAGTRADGNPLRDRWRPAIPLIALWGWSFVGIGMNPWLWKPYGVALGLTRMTGEAFARNLEWARPAVAEFPLFYLSLILVVGLPIGARRLAGFPAFAVIGMLACMSLLSLRFMGIYFLALPFFCAPYFGMRSMAGVRWGRGTPIRVLGESVLLLLLGTALFLHAIHRHPVRADFRRPDRFPMGAVEFLRGREIAPGHLFNDVKFGGYLIWSRFPERQVFIDGRNEVYPDVLREIHGALDSGPAWRGLMNRYGIDSALLRYPPSLSPVVYPGNGKDLPRRDYRPFSTLYFPREEWALVHWDDAAMLFLKRVPDYQELIRENEYRVLRPDDHRHQIRRAVADDSFRESVLEEVERKLREDPDCRRARDLYKMYAAGSALTRNVNR